MPHYDAVIRSTSMHYIAAVYMAAILLFVVASSTEKESLTYVAWHVE
jgi:hypothetical protein